jgi:F0F1-type ATP synthase assembly protein I
MPDPDLLTTVARVSGTVLQMTLTVVLGFFLGGWLDDKLGTSPLLLLGLGIGGLILGFWRMHSELQKARRNDDPDQRS